jgi:hypothetical protein
MDQSTDKNSIARRVSDYQLIDHGIDHSQYFPGCGTAFTPYDHCVTGCGDNFAEALDDALEMMAQGTDAPDDIDAFEKEMLADEELTEWPSAPSVSEEEQFNENYHYFVSIRYNLA